MRRTGLLILTVAIGIGAWLLHAQASGRRDAMVDRTVRVREKPHAERAVYGGPMQGYKIQEGQIAGADTPAAPGASKVDTLDLRQAYQRAAALAASTRGKVFKDTLTPHWFADNTCFWYRNELSEGAKEFVVVDAAKGKRAPAFDHDRLAAALTQAADKKYDGKRLPFEQIEFIDGQRAVLFKVEGSAWQCDLSSYECSRAAREPKVESKSDEAEQPEPQDDAEPAPDVDDEPQQKKFGKKGFAKRGSFGAPAATREARSPDGRWTAFIKDSNVFLRDGGGKEVPVTTKGAAGDAFTAFTWSPDSRSLVAYCTKPGDNKEVYMIETSPRDQLPAKLHVRLYPRPGDNFALHEMWLLAPPAGDQVGPGAPVQVAVERLWGPSPPRLRWAKDARRFTFEYAERSRQRFRVIEVDASSGKTRNLIDELTETFFWTMHPPRTGLAGIDVRYLDTDDEMLLVSQRDGWKHLYLVDAKGGRIKTQITKGAWVVRAIDRVDKEKRQIWFRASGKNAGQDPYLLHHYRVNFDGSGLVALTEGNGDHSVQFSPDRQHLIDTYSRVDLPPVHELRRASDGGLVCRLEEADVSALIATGWKPPQVFVAKGRDGRTDIWGIVHRPRDHAQGKKYPVIEAIYAGPHDSHVPKRFSAYFQAAALAELGFIVVQIDGMGTANRSRAFHDVCWQNIADAGFPDRILWLQALAARDETLDITRVGIYGTSAGGQNALGALLFHPEFYKVAVASCGCHDNRLDKWSWNEQWMGLMGPHYEQQSNVTNAHKLQGKLLLIVGELDTNVPFESTMRVVDALIRARKDFDFIFVPGMGHSSGGAYGDRRRLDFFVRHLHGLEPPDRNTPAQLE